VGDLDDPDLNFQPHCFTTCAYSKSGSLVTRRACAGRHAQRGPDQRELLRCRVVFYFVLLSPQFASGVVLGWGHGAPVDFDLGGTVTIQIRSPN